MNNLIQKLGLKLKNCFLVENWFVLYLHIIFFFFYYYFTIYFILLFQYYRSHDDLFVLYAAFSSGKKAIVISKDLMRKQKFGIQNKELNILFNKWQFAYQYYFDKEKGLVKLNSQTQIDAVVQKKNDYWHIPYVLHKTICRERHTCFNDWICLKINK